MLAKKHPPPPDFHSTLKIEAETDRLLYSVTMEDFQEEKHSPNHSVDLDWRDNGCTSAPDKPFGYNFLPSCQRHDFCYLNYRKQGRYEKLKPQCDDNFQWDMYNECGKTPKKARHCRSVARMYHWAVKAFGDNYDMYQLPPDVLEALQGGDMDAELSETDIDADGEEE